MPSLRSMLLLVPLAASSFANGQPTNNDDPVVRRNDIFESRRAASEQRQGIVGVGRDAIARAVEESVFKRYLRKRQSSNTTLAVTVTVPDVVTATVSLPLGGGSSTSSSPSSQGQSLTSSIPTSSSAAQDPVSTETVVSTTLISVPATTEQQPATSSEGQTPPTTSASSSSSLPAVEPSSSFVSSEPGSSSSVAPPPSSDQPSSSVPVVANPTSDPVTSNPPSSSAVQPTTAAAQPSSTTLAVIDSKGSVVTSVPSAATISDVVFTSPTPGGVYTGTEADGNVLIVTYTPDGGTVSEVRFLTTTLPNGSVSKVTSYATVGAPADPTSESSNSQPNGDQPQLQSGAALPSTWYAAELAVMFGAAVGAAAIML